MEKRIGILGGSFDPVHIGHLIIAQDAYEQFELDRILLLPAYQAPLKAKTSLASPEQRLQMLRIATRDDPRFDVSDAEFQLGEISYSVATAALLREQHPGAELFWIIGADQIAQLHHWREIDKLASLVSFIAFDRPGSPSQPSPNLPDHLRILRAKARSLDISSTEIRRRLNSRLPAKYFLPEGVFDYINTENLYQETHVE